MDDFNTIKLNEKVVLSILTAYVCTKFNIHKNDVHSAKLEYPNEFYIQFTDVSFEDEEDEIMPWEQTEGDCTL